MIIHILFIYFYSDVLLINANKKPLKWPYWLPLLFKDKALAGNYQASSKLLSVIKMKMRMAPHRDGDGLAITNKGMMSASIDPLLVIYQWLYSCTVLCCCWETLKMCDCRSANTAVGTTTHSLKEVGGSNHRQPLFNVCFALEAIGYFLCSTVDNLLLFELTSVPSLFLFSRPHSQFVHMASPQCHTVNWSNEFAKSVLCMCECAPEDSCWSMALRQFLA